jgi:hypothetical protein
MKSVDFTRCTHRWAIVDVKTGRAFSCDSSKYAEVIAHSKSYSDPCVIIDLHTMQICDVFVEDGHMSVGLLGIQFREEHLDLTIIK